MWNQQILSLTNLLLALLLLLLSLSLVSLLAATELLGLLLQVLIDGSLLLCFFYNNRIFFTKTVAANLSISSLDALLRSAIICKCISRHIFGSLWHLVIKVSQDPFTCSLLSTFKYA